AHADKDTVDVFADVALFALDVGDFPKAEALLQRVLTIREKALGPEHPLTALRPETLADLYNLNTAHNNPSYFAKAESLYLRALKIREKALGLEHPDTANTLGNLAMTYCNMGDYANAGPLYLRALKIREKTLGPDNPATAG